MSINTPSNWRNPIHAAAGQLQADVDPRQLLPSRLDLSQKRLDIQAELMDAGIERSTPIQVD